MYLLHLAGLALFSLGGLGLVGVFLFFQFKYRHWKGQNIRCTTPHFPLGNAWCTVFVRHLGVAFKDIYDQFKGERFNGMWVIHRPYLMIRDPDLIRTICIRDFSHFCDRGFYFTEKRDPLAGNIFVLKGAKWRNLRTRLSPTFTSGRLKAMFHVMAERGAKLVEQFLPAASRQEVVETKEPVTRYTVDVITACILGVQSDSLGTGSEALFRSMGKKVFEPRWNVVIRSALCFLVPDIAGIFKIVNTPPHATKFFMKFVREVFEYREVHDLKQNDFMQLILQMSKQGFIQNADQNGNMDTGKANLFGYHDAVAAAFIFWVGGFETSSTTMQFALFEMAKNQAIQTRARREVQKAIAAHGGRLTYEGAQEMEYLARVIEEALRKYPPVAIINRECTKRYQIPDSDVIVEKGVSVLIPVLGIHMDPEHYPEPERFDPERFSEEQKKTRHHYTFLPFGEGPHSCIGQRFARMQMRVGLAALIAHYQFDMCDRTPLNPEMEKKMLVFTTKEGMHLRISHLKN